MSFFKYLLNKGFIPVLFGIVIALIPDICAVRVYMRVLLL